jgi:hypothetical protein
VVIGNIDITSKIALNVRTLYLSYLNPYYNIRAMQRLF